MTRRGILTGGTWCVDRNLLVDCWPKENGRANILSSELGGGGSGSNLAVAVRALDDSMPVATITVVGDDADGHFLRELAAANGIDQAKKFTDIGLYSITFSNEVDFDAENAEAYSAFRAEAAEHGMRHFLEVFNPAFDIHLAEGGDIGSFVNDNIVRTLAGVIDADRHRFADAPDRRSHGDPGRSSQGLPRRTAEARPQAGPFA